MAHITIKRGDRLPVIARQFLTDDSPTDLTGASVTFNMWDAASGAQVITNGACTVVTAATGDVEYPWSSADATLPAGNYVASFTASFAGPRLLTAPNNGMLSIQILETMKSTWSYTNNPQARTLDKVRFLIGDTDENAQQLLDAEIEFLLAEWEDDPYVAAAEACIALSGKVMMKADYSRSVGDVSLSTQYQAQAKSLIERAMNLRLQSERLTAPIVNFYTDDNGNVFGPMNFSVGMDNFRD